MTPTRKSKPKKAPKPRGRGPTAERPIITDLQRAALYKFLNRPKPH